MFITLTIVVVYWAYYAMYVLGMKKLFRDMYNKRVREENGFNYTAEEKYLWDYLIGEAEEFREAVQNMRSVVRYRTWKKLPGALAEVVCEIGDVWHTLVRYLMFTILWTINDAPAQYYFRYPVWVVTGLLTPLSVMKFGDRYRRQGCVQSHNPRKGQCVACGVLPAGAVEKKAE
jgi:hypothetical protein